MRPLAGLTVVTLEHAIAAPFCTRQLADLGARVIKIERPGVGDFARGYDEILGRKGPHANMLMDFGVLNLGAGEEWRSGKADEKALLLAAGAVVVARRG